MLHHSSDVKAWDTGESHELSCIMSMPHLRAVGLANVLAVRLADVISRLACICMRQPQELHLGVRHVDIPEGGDASKVYAIRDLTTLEAVGLKLSYDCCKPAQGSSHELGILLRGLQNKRVTVREHIINFEGTRDPADMLGMLRAAAPWLNPWWCSIEERGKGLPCTGPVQEHQPYFEALKGEFDPDVSMLVCARMSTDGFGPWNVPPNFLATLPGLQSLSVPGVRASAIDPSSSATLGRELHLLQCLMMLDVAGTLLQGLKKFLKSCCVLSRAEYTQGRRGGSGVRQQSASVECRTQSRRWSD